MERADPLPKKFVELLQRIYVELNIVVSPGPSDVLCLMAGACHLTCHLNCDCRPEKDGFHSYGPKKRSPSKWIKCDGASAHHTSVSQAILPRCRAMITRDGNAVT